MCEEADTESEPLQTGADIIVTEMRNYNSLKCHITEYSCPLEFYKLNLMHLPNMARIAKMLFCVTASSVPSECTFSKSGQIITPKRSRLIPELAEELLILSLNKFD